MEVKTYTIDEIKNIVTPIAEKYQIAQVYLFGSFARGDLRFYENPNIYEVAELFQEQTQTPQITM